MALTLADLFASPDHYLHSFEGDMALFVAMDPAAYRRSIFLDRRIDAAGAGTMRLPVATLTGHIPRSSPTGWIFHIAHCGSTLLARALDGDGHNDGGQAGLVLREPQALRQVAISPDSTRLALVGAMLGKRYAAEVSTIVKANVPVNFLLPQLARRDPSARAILLHLALDDYLFAILRSDDHRGWLRNVTTQLAPYLGDLAGFADAERAAALWLAQRRAFAGAIAAMPAARTLDAETFFARPADVLAAAAAHLGRPMPEEEVRAIVAGPLFARHSKNPALVFDDAARRARRAALFARIAPEIVAAQAWIERFGAGPDPFGQEMRDAALVID